MPVPSHSLRHPWRLVTLLALAAACLPLGPGASATAPASVAWPGAAAAKTPVPVAAPAPRVRVVRDVVYATAPDGTKLRLDLYLPDEPQPSPGDAAPGGTSHDAPGGKPKPQSDAPGGKPKPQPDAPADPAAPKLEPAPPVTEATRPAVLLIHGGSWRGGNKKHMRRFGYELARQGYVAASVQYRLSPKYHFPAHIHDCKAAVRWLRAHAGEYRIDAKKVGALGVSAGAHLALLLGMTAGNAKLEGTLGNSSQSSRVQAVVSYFGPTDFTGERSRINPLAVRTVLDFLGSDDKAVAKLASPRQQITRDDAPTLLLHGKSDWLVPYQQSVLMHEALVKARVPAKLLLYEGQGHGFRGNIEKPENPTRAVANFFARFLKGEKIPDAAFDGPQKPAPPKKPAPEGAEEF